MAKDTDSADGAILHTKQNVSPAVLANNKRINAKALWRGLSKDWTGLDEVILLGGGPSLNDTRKELDALIARRLPIVTVNGSYHWAMNHHIWPALQLVVDAQEHNARFTHPVFPGTRYIIANHCHHSILLDLPDRNTYIWDRSIISGGSTVMLCAVPLLRWMGVKKIHMFGFDSCLSEEQHHAYPQAENDGEEVLTIDVNEHLFKATRWMVSQAEEFLEISKEWGDFTVYGDGLIAHLIKD